MEQKIIKSEELESCLAAIKKERNVHHALLVCGNSFRKQGLYQQLEDALKKEGMELTEFSDFEPNPKYESVISGIKTYRQKGCDLILAAGGGSAMDVAKCIKLFNCMNVEENCLKQEIISNEIPFLAIPTTAGTGSETTLAAVITDAETRHKYAINDFPLIPRYAVLDPKVTLSLPPSITATTGMDALTHAVEAYIGRSTTPGTRKDALMAVALIFRNLDDAYEDGTNLEARRNMLKASYYAGCAFTKSYVGYVHAVAHSLGGEYNVPHGLANAILLPFVLEAYGPAIYKKLSTLAVAAGLADENTPQDEAAIRFIDAIKAMKKRFRIGNTISAIHKEDIPKLARYADKEANPLYPVPVLMDARKLESFYYQLMKTSDTSDNESV